MRRRLVLSTALIALSAVLVLGVPLGIVEGRRARSEAATRLEREADTVAARVDDPLEAGQRILAASLRPLVRPGHQVSLTDRRGRVVTVGRIPAGATVAETSALAPGAHVTAREPKEEVSERVRHTWLLIGLLGVGGTGAAVALAGLQARRLARPLEHLAQTSDRLGLGDFSVRAGRFGVPEIDAVAAALDTTAVRIARLIGREREFSADVSHQLRTPLTALRLRLEELQQLEDPALIATEVTAALTEADRLERMISELLAAQAKSGRRASADPASLAAVARQHAEGWRRTYARAARRLAVEISDCDPVEGTPGVIGQALDVLLENALRHGAGTVTVAVAQRQGHGCLSVEDEGTGVPPGAQQDVFRRGESLDGGTGIGLHLARALVEGDGGRLVLARGRLARFELHLPLAGPASEHPKAT